MSASSGPVIVTCAVIDAIHTLSMSPHLPIAPEQITAEAVAAAQAAGAAIIRLVAKIPSILSSLDFEVATPAQGREMLGTKDGDRVNF